MRQQTLKCWAVCHFVTWMNHKHKVCLCGIPSAAQIQCWCFSQVCWKLAPSICRCNSCSPSKGNKSPGLVIWVWFEYKSPRSELEQSPGSWVGRAETHKANKTAKSLEPFILCWDEEQAIVCGCVHGLNKANLSRLGKDYQATQSFQTIQIPGWVFPRHNVCFYIHQS